MLQSTFVRLFFVVVAALGITNCSPSNEAPNPMRVNPGWTPNQLTYTCADESQCPDNQGVLLGVKEIREDHYLYVTVRRSVLRCTATLYAPTKVITAGHCNAHLADYSRLYFKTVARTGRPSRTILVAHDLGYSWPETRPGQGDYGAFELAEPVDDVTYGHPPVHEAVGDEMIALVSNMKSSDQNTLVLDAVKCKVEAGAPLPIPYSQNPVSFLVQDCVLHSGNSGGAVVQADDLFSIYGIVSFSNNADNAGKVVSSDADHSNGMTPEPDWAGITNAACVTLPDWLPTKSPCVAITKETVSRFEQGVLLKIADHQREAWKTSKFAHQDQDGGPLSIDFNPEMGVFDSGDKAGSVIVPIPECLNGNLENHEATFTFGLDAVQVARDFKSIYSSRPFPNSWSGKMTLLPLGPEDEYFVQYSFATEKAHVSLRSPFNMMQLTFGKTMQIRPCEDI